MKYKAHTKKGEVKVFSRVQDKRVVRGTHFTFLNVPDMNKHGLIAYCAKQKNAPTLLLNHHASFIFVET